MGDRTTFDPSQISIRAIHVLQHLISGKGSRPATRFECVAWAKEWVQVEKNLVRMVLRVEVEGDREDGKGSALGEFELQFWFHLVDLDSWYNSETGALDSFLTNTLRMLAYSTSRGLLYAQTMATRLARFVLPVIHPADIRGWKEPI